MTNIEPKDQAEVITPMFRYADEIGAGVISQAVVTVSVVEGVDASPASMLQGAPQIQGSNVLQLVKDGVVGVRYKARCLATMDDGRKLVRTYLFQVVNA